MSIRHFLSPILRRFRSGNAGGGGEMEAGNENGCDDDNDIFDVLDDKENQQRVPPLARHSGDLLSKAADLKRHSQTNASKYRSPPSESEKQRGSSLRDIVLKTRHAKLAVSESIPSSSSQSAHIARASSVPISGDSGSGGSLRKKHWRNSFTASSSGDPSRCVSRSSSNPESLTKDDARRRMLSWKKATLLRKSSTSPSPKSSLKERKSIPSQQPPS